MSSHWWRFLPDSGGYYMVDSQESKAGRITDHLYKVAQIQKEMDAEDEEIFRQALSCGWAIEEITAAKADAKKYDSPRDKLNAVLLKW